MLDYDRKGDMNMEILIREMKESDWEDVKCIYCEGIEEGKSTFTTQCPTYSEWNKSHIAECRLVAVMEDRVVGWIAISRTSARECYRGEASVSIYIARDYRGRGVGYRLLSYLCEESEKHGYWTLTSWIFAENEASIKIHERCGFQLVGYREKIAKNIFGEWQDTILMERRSTYR